LRPEAGVTGWLIRITTALAVGAVALASPTGLRTRHGEPRLTARLLPFTVDGLLILVVTIHWPS
jgi:hypothetical protein